MDTPTRSSDGKDCYSSQNELIIHLRNVMSDLSTKDSGTRALSVVKHYLEKPVELAGTSPRPQV